MASVLTVLVESTVAGRTDSKPNLLKILVAIFSKWCHFVSIAYDSIMCFIFHFFFLFLFSEISKVLLVFSNFFFFSFLFLFSIYHS